MNNYTIEPKHIKLIKIDAETFLFYHIETMQIYPINDVELIHFLELFAVHGEKDIHNYFSKEEIEFYKENIDNVIASSPKSTIAAFDENQQSDYNTVVLPIVSDCNLNCPYCFAHSESGFNFGSFTNDDIVKTLEFVVNENKLKNKKNFSIVFFGGEPLLNPEAIRFTIEYMKTNYPDYNIFYSITTNGTILNEDIINLFREHKVAVLVSIDGPDNEFNLRYYKNGKKSLSKVISNIEELKKSNITMELRATIVNTNPYIFETIDFLEKFEVPFYFCFAYPSENKSHNLSTYDKKTLLGISKQFEQLLAYYLDKFKKKEIIYNKRMHDYINILRFRNRIGAACGAGRTYFTITANGNIFSCPHFMNDSQYIMGNIDNNVLENEKYISINVDDIQECQHCWAKYYCAGNCLAQKVSLGKSNKMASIGEACELEKILFEFYIKLFYFAKKFVPEYFITEPVKEKVEQEKLPINC